MMNARCRIEARGAIRRRSEHVLIAVSIGSLIIWSLVSVYNEQCKFFSLFQ